MINKFCKNCGVKLVEEAPGECCCCATCRNAAIKHLKKQKAAISADLKKNKEDKKIFSLIKNFFSKPENKKDEP